MSAPVRIEAEAWTDLRFATLARLLGLADADHALIRTARLWGWQAEHYTPEAPTYVVDQDTVESALGAAGAAAALVRARLADEVPEGFRVRGAVGRIEWLYRVRQASKAGGEATQRKHRDKTRPASQPTPEPSPSSLIPTLTPDLDQKDPPPARAIAPTEPAAAAPVGRPRRELVRERLWELLENVRADLANELGLRATPLVAFDPGRAELAAKLSLGDASGNLETVERQARHAIAIAAAEARRDGSLQWLTGAIFGDRPFRRLCGMTLEDAKRPRPALRGEAPRPAAAPKRKRAEPAPKVVPAAELADVAAIAAEALRKGFAIEPRAGPQSVAADDRRDKQPAKETTR